MKLVHIETLISRGDFPNSKEYAAILGQVQSAIASIHWPKGTNTFTLNNSKKHCNGVTPIKLSCIGSLKEAGWTVEEQMRLTANERPGKVDAIRTLGDRRVFVVEWETGNVSSSHRALNKIVVGMMDSIAAGGILIVPSRSMYPWLTDRIGNYTELVPYFPLWKNAGEMIADGVLAIAVVEHDALSLDVPTIAKGTDGRALR